MPVQLEAFFTCLLDSITKQSKIDRVETFLL